MELLLPAPKYGIFPMEILDVGAALEGEDWEWLREGLGSEVVWEFHGISAPMPKSGIPEGPKSLLPSQILLDPKSPLDPYNFSQILSGSQELLVSQFPPGIQVPSGS